MLTARTNIFLALAVLAIFASSKLPAAEIYHWVDENGVQHFSQYRPSGDIPDLSTQKLQDTAPPGNGELEDVYNIEEHEKRMTEWREDRDKKREEARERERQQAQQQPKSYPEQYNRYARPYWYRPAYGRPPYRPPNKPRPPVTKPTPPSHLVPPGGIRQR